MRRILAALVLCLHTGGVYAQDTGLLSSRVPSRSQIEDLEAAFGVAPIQEARPINKITIELIKSFEGWSATAYNDPVGYCTIGYGHLIALSNCDRIDLKEFGRSLTRDAGEALLEKDTRSARLAVQELVAVELSSDQFGALVSFTFNVGKANFAKSSLLKLVNRSELELASAEFMRWIKADNKVLPGLVARRACEQILFQEALKLNNQGQFDRASCSSLGIAPDTSFLVDINAGEF